LNLRTWFDPQGVTRWVDPVSDTLDALSVAVRRMDNVLALPPRVPAIGRLVRREQWRLYMQVFSLWGSTCKPLFSLRQMQLLMGISRTDWQRYLDVLIGGGVVVVRSRSWTRWVGPWNHKRLVRYIKFDVAPLPYPSDYDPPPISLRWSGTDDAVGAGAQFAVGDCAAVQKGM